MVSILIVGWNSKELLNKNLPILIQASKNPKNKIDQIIIVDNGSRDGSVELLEKNYPGILLFSNKENQGYAKACNFGIKKATNNLVVILNPDVIPNKDFLENCLPLFSDEKIFSVSFNEGNFGPGKIVWEKGFLEIKKTSAEEKITTSDWPSGGSSIFKKEIWEKLGGMNDLFSPAYFEDVDLGLRALSKGFKCLWDPASKVEHQHESSINKNYYNENKLSLIKERNHLLLTWINIKTIKMFFSHIIYLFLRIIVHPGYLKVLLSAVFSSIKAFI